ncbi:MAG: tetratricopeptide repeat protein [Sphingomonadaceae bacterium]
MKSLPRILSTILVGAAGLYLAWWVVKAAAVNALTDGNPLAAAMVSPGHPEIAARMAEIEFRQRRGAVSPAAMERIKKALYRAPLSDEAFFYGGLEAVMEDDGRRALPLFEEARRRQPRERTTRLLLLDQYLRAGETQASANELVLLTQLIPQAGKVLYGELARLASDPQTRPALAEALRDDPEISSNLLARLAETGADPDLILALAGELDTSRHRSWQQPLLESLVERGDYRRARALWRQFADIKEQPEQSVYDPRFRGLRGPPPFNWALGGGGEAIVELGRGAGLTLEFYGRRDAALASQLLTLPSGEYRLRLAAEGESDGEGGMLLAKVVCADGEKELLSLPLTELDYVRRRFGSTFDVPARDCDAQWLRIEGKGAEFPSTQRATFVSIEIEKAPEEG